MEAVVRLVEDPVELVVLPGGDELAHRPVVEPIPLDAVGRAFVPQVAAVERQAKPRALSPQQAAEQAIAERDRLVPRGDGSLHREVQVGAREAADARLRRLNGRRRNDGQHDERGENLREAHGEILALCVDW